MSLNETEQHNIYSIRILAHNITLIRTNFNLPVVEKHSQRNNEIEKRKKTRCDFVVYANERSSNPKRQQHRTTLQRHEMKSETEKAAAAEPTTTSKNKI